MSSIPAPSTTRPSAPTQSTQSTQSAQTEEIPKGPWRDHLANETAVQKEAGFLSDDRVKSFKENVEKKMEKWLADPKNEGATEEQINAQFVKERSASYGHEMLGQVQFDYFVKKMTDRAKELSQDMWK